MRGIRFLPFLALSLTAHAAAIFSTPMGSTVSDGPVNASATFTLLSSTQLQIVLADNLPNPTSVGQLLSDLSFSVTGISGLSLTSMSSAGIQVAGNGSSTSTGAVTSGWTAGTTGGGAFVVCVLCPTGFPSTDIPAELIIGPPGSGGTYTSANGSIAGNGPHNPFLNQTATFTFNVTGFTTSAMLSNVVFSFGTSQSPNSDVMGTLSGGINPLTPTPEPDSAMLAVVAFGILAGVARLRRRGAFHSGSSTASNC